MKKNRLFLLLLWILSLVGISFYGGPVSYGFFIMVTMVPVISLIYLLCVFIRFRIYQELDSNSLVSNQMVPFYFTLQNEDYFTYSGVRVSFFSSFCAIHDLEDNVEYELLPGTGIRRETSLVCRYRGEYEVGIEKVRIQDCFRLFQITYRNRETLRVMVKPNRVQLSGLRSVEDLLAAAGESRQRKAEPDVLVRKYVQGDDIRHMHWKATAASGELLVRNKIGEEQQGVSILMSTCRFSKKQAEYLPPENKVLETALALTYYFVNKKIAVRTCYLEEHVVETVTESVDRYDGYYEQLSAVCFEENYTDEALFTGVWQSGLMNEGRLVFFVLQKWSVEAAAMAEFLNQNNIPVVAYVITDSAEEQTHTGRLSRTSIVTVNPDDKLTEVL
ncbi:MAG: DUF58 domain-containing protein [Lachnospiraceae bacterium]|nr:DUF58 domain-containing protein [Lachnospiraceae bacterium]